VRTERVEDLNKALASRCWQERVAALKIIREKGIEIADLPAYQKVLLSPYIPERCWLAQALGGSKRPETYYHLVAYLDDPHPNVVSMAFHALGQRRDRRAIKEIVERIKASDNWYNQWYAYRALRTLGWKQSKSE
jgi:HEAT repeat protein